MDEDGLEGNDGVAVVVVGDVDEEMAAAVDSLTRGAALAWDERTTAAGVRILSRKCGVRVISTTRLRNVQHKSPTAIARRWISQNSLRQIAAGKMVFVVCVVTSAIVEEPCKTVFADVNCWLDVLGLIWGNRKNIMFLVNPGGCNVSPKSLNLIRHCLARHRFSSENVLFSMTDDCTRTAVEASVRKMYPSFCGLSEGMTDGVDGGGDSRRPILYGKPFFIRKPSSSAGRSGREPFEPWGSERVILIGKTGSGKSTLAQMLTLGRLDRHATKLRTSSGIRGASEEVERGEGRGWYVVDTPGFGEPQCEASSVSTFVAQEKVKRFVAWDEGTFSHYLFVIKKGRIDELEMRLWNFFKLLFGASISHHVSLVISGADDQWLEGNVSYLQAAFDGCSSFLTADFPAIDNDDEVETEYQDLRTDSLLRLEQALAALNRTDLVCKFGERSTMHRLNEKHRAYIDAEVDEITAFFVDFFDRLGLISILKGVDDHMSRIISKKDNISIED